MALELTVFSRFRRHTRDRSPGTVPASRPASGPLRCPHLSPRWFLSLQHTAYRRGPQASRSSTASSNQNGVICQHLLHISEWKRVCGVRPHWVCDETSDIVGVITGVMRSCEFHGKFSANTVLDTVLYSSQHVCEAKQMICATPNCYTDLFGTPSPVPSP